MILAKTEPELTLAEHTEDVLSEAECVLARLRYGDKYRRLTGHDLRRRLLEAARYHDLGKAHPRWQRHARNGSLREVGLRHELASLVHLDRKGKDLEPPVQVAVAAHHSKLSWRHRHRWTETAFSWEHLGEERSSFEELWEAFSTLEKNLFLSGDFASLVRTRYEYDVIRGLLQLADRRASQIEDPPSPDPLPLRPYRYSFPYRNEDGSPSYRPVQRAVVEHADRPLLALRSETGSGKTAAALLWAREQVRAGRARRAIIALPTRFTSSSLAADVSSSVDAGLYHSSAWQQLQDETRAAEKLRMARQFLYPLTVTTIDQVLTCLTGRREEHHLRFANLAHSCLIIDECDFYDDFVQANIERLMAVLRVLEVPVLVMSATLPTSHLPVYTPRLSEDEEPEETGEGLVDTTRAGNRIRVASITPWDDSTELPARLQRAVSERERVIVYASTVARAVAYFDAIAEMREDAVLYHSRFIEPHKAAKEAAIRKMLGREGQGGVAVMTQIGEMSLNISAPVMISEACPIDRLAQRTGRMGRFSGTDGTLHLIIPRRKGSLYPAPYGTLSPRYDWTPSEALTATLDLLQEGQRLTKADLTALTNEVYDRPVEYSPEARQNAEQLEEDLRGQWLIVPEAQIGPDDTEAATWQSRMIGLQVDVFVTPEPLKSDFDSYWSFEDARARHTVTLPHYQYRKSPERFEWAKVNVEGEEEQVLLLADPGEYTWERGLV